MANFPQCPKCGVHSLVDGICWFARCDELAQERRRIQERQRFAPIGPHPDDRAKNPEDA